MATRARVPVHLTYTPELFENARRRYEETGEPIVTIAADLRIHAQSVRRLARNHNWIRRNKPPPRDLSPAMRLLEQARAVEVAEAHALAEGDTTPPTDSRCSASASLPLKDGGQRPPMPSSPLPRVEPGVVGGGETAPAEPSTIERLERAVLAELATVEAMRASLGPLPQRWTDAERTARTLGLLTQTLQHLQRLRAGHAAQARTG